MTPPLFVLAWILVAVYAVDDSGVTGYHLHHTWTFEECETLREQYTDAPYVSKCEPIAAMQQFTDAAVTPP